MSIKLFFIIIWNPPEQFDYVPAAFSGRCSGISEGVFMCLKEFKNIY